MFTRDKDAERGVVVKSKKEKDDALFSMRDSGRKFLRVMEDEEIAYILTMSMQVGLSRMSVVGPGYETSTALYDILCNLLVGRSRVLNRFMLSKGYHKKTPDDWLVFSVCYKIFYPHANPEMIKERFSYACHREEIFSSFMCSMVQNFRDKMLYQFMNDFRPPLLGCRLYYVNGTNYNTLTFVIYNSSQSIVFGIPDLLYSIHERSLAQMEVKRHLLDEKEYHDIYKKLMSMSHRLSVLEEGSHVLKWRVDVDQKSKVLFSLFDINLEFERRCKFQKKIEGMDHAEYCLHSVSKNNTKIVVSPVKRSYSIVGLSCGDIICRASTECKRRPASDKDDGCTRDNTKGVLPWRSSTVLSAMSLSKTVSSLTRGNKEEKGKSIVSDNTVIVQHKRKEISEREVENHTAILKERSDDLTILNSDNGTELSGEHTDITKNYTQDISYCD